MYGVWTHCTDNCTNFHDDHYLRSRLVCPVLCCTLWIIRLCQFSVVSYDLNRLFDCSYEHDLFDNNMDVFAAAMKAQSLQNQRPNMCINFRMPHYKIIF